MDIKTKINELLHAGENSSIEFKTDQVRAESLAKEMVAFSNSFGGTILIGVNDDGRITGCTTKKPTEEWIMNIARQNVIPAITPSCILHTQNNKTILVIDIPKGNQKPYQTNDNKFLVRVGSTNRTATQPELMRLFQQSGFFHYDLVSVFESSERDLNLTQIDEYFEQYNISFLHETNEERVRLLKNVDILAENDECTIAGLLLFGINPQKRLLNASISIAQFKGTAIGSELIDTKNITGPLPIQVETATSLIKNLIPVETDIKGSKRSDVTTHYSDKVFRELIVNAVVHRNYSIDGSRIRILMFDNRIEVRSPGRLPNTVSIDKIVSGVSYAINPVLLKFMENMRYVDKLGRGIPMVYAEAKKLGKDILFEEIGEEFVVTLFL